MAKTRSRTRNIAVKKEEVEEDRKPKLLLNGVENTKSNNKITKKKPSKRNNRSLPVQQVKVEEDTDTKSLLQSGSKSSELPKRQRVSQEQINQLINAIVNDKMNITKASYKVKISRATEFRYYNLYKNDPEKKIPVPRTQLMHPPIFSTQEQIENLFRYINEDKITIAKASAKLSVSYTSGRYYYKKYLKDPNHNIPTPRLLHHYTQDQKNEFIGYIVNDKMNIAAASKKAKMSADSGRRYYHKYFDDQNPDIATPRHIVIPRHYTQEQIKELISYIVKGKMSIAAASRKVKMNHGMAGIYYRRYLKDNNMEIPVSKFSKRYTQEQMNGLVKYIVDDKMTLTAASKKSNIPYRTCYRYYLQDVKDRDVELPSSRSNRQYTQEQTNEVTGYIVYDKMNITAASKKKQMYITRLANIVQEISKRSKAWCTYLMSLS